MRQLTLALALGLSLSTVADGQVISRVIRHPMGLPLTASGGGGGSLNPHPRLWLTPTMQTLVSAKAAASNASWVAMKADGDDLAARTLPIVTITAASNASPVSFTISQTVPWTTDQFIFIAGATGAWTLINNDNLSPVTKGDAWTATRTGTNTFTIPVNSAAFGSFSGQTLTVFVQATDVQPASSLNYDFSGVAWKEAFTEWGLLYRTLGTTSYRTKALALLDYINTLGAAGMNAPIAYDQGRATLGAGFGLALAYDWFYPDLSAAQRNATIVTLNRWAYFIANAGPGVVNAYTDPRSNYYFNHLTFLEMIGYGTFGDNSEAQSWLDQVASNYTTNFVIGFAAPSTVTKTSEDFTGFYYTGMPNSGLLYGGNDISRISKFYDMIKSATNAQAANAIVYQKIFANLLIYLQKPDRYHTITNGQWNGAWYGIMPLSEALLLTHTLVGTTEGQWIQWLYLHEGARPSGADLQSLPESFDLVMFEDVTRTQTDYGLTQPVYINATGGEGWIIWRSDWTDASEWAAFSTTGGHYSGSFPKHAGHIELTRGTDNLLLTASYTHGTDDGTSGDPSLGYTTAPYTNTMNYWDGGQSPGPGRCYSYPNGYLQNDTYFGCQLGQGKYIAPTAKLASTYAYAVTGNLATAYDYDSNASPTLRTEQYSFRTFAALGNGTYVVLDRVQSTASEHLKEFRWHIPATNAPVLSAQTSTTTLGASQIALTTLLPASATIAVERDTPIGRTFTALSINASDSTKISGNDTSGNPLTSGDIGKVFTLTSGTGIIVQQATILSVASGVATCDKPIGIVGSINGAAFLDEPAAYRLLVTDPNPSMGYIGLTVIQTAADDATLATPTLLEAIDSNFAGIQVDDATTPKVFLAPKNVTNAGSGIYTSPTYTGVSFSTSHSGTADYLIGGLSAGFYTVRRGGSSIATPTADNGTIRFSSTSGNFTVN